MLASKGQSLVVQACLVTAAWSAVLSLVYYSDCMVQHYGSQHSSPDNDFMRTCMYKHLPFTLVLSVLTVAMCKSTKWSTWTVPCLLDVIALGRFINLH